MTQLPTRAAWLALRDTGIATLLATIVAAPFVFLAVKGEVDQVIDPATMPTCSSWELTAPTVAAPEAQQALALVQSATDGERVVTWELIEKQGAAWLKGCFPDGTGGRKVSQLLGSADLFAGTVSIEWPDLADRVFPQLIESMESYFLPIALASPLAFGLTALFFIRRRGLQNIDRSASWERAIPLGIGAGVCFYAIVTLAERGLAAAGIQQQEQGWILGLVERGGAELASLVVFAVLIGPLGEELFFRRYLFEALDRSAGRAWAYGLSTLLFALVHMNPAALISYCLTGLLLAAVYARTRSLLAAFAAHGCFNALGMLQLILLS